MEVVSLNQANEFYRRGYYSEALLAYKYLLLINPQLINILEMNIKHVQARLVSLYQNSQPEITLPIINFLSLGDIERYIEDSLINEELEVFSTYSPLVSIIVTTHNIEEYIEQSLNSILKQTYTNLEIIVVDDYSSDGTIKIVKQMSEKFSNIKLYQLNCNLGTYFAKNYGIQQSCGEVVFFQDGDDISHPQRIALMMQIFKDNIAVRCGYLRYDSSDNSIIKINSSYTRLGLITLGFKKFVFEQIGYYNCTTKGSDDEFFQRFINYYGKNAIAENSLPLYYAVIRENSLSEDMLNPYVGGGFLQSNSEVREGYVNQFKQLHKNLSPNQFNKFFCFPRIRDAIPVVTELSLLCNPKSLVIINLFVFPGKLEDILDTIESLINQSDKITICSNIVIPINFEKFGNKVIVHDWNMLTGLKQPNSVESLFSETAYYLNLTVVAKYPPDFVNTIIKHIQYVENNQPIRIISQTKELAIMGVGFYSTLLQMINLKQAIDYADIPELLISLFINAGISIQDVIFNGLDAK